MHRRNGFRYIVTIFTMFLLGYRGPAISVNRRSRRRTTTHGPTTLEAPDRILTLRGSLATGARRASGSFSS